MKLDVGVAVDANPLPTMAETARLADKLGFSAIWVPETKHNPFLPLAIAAEHSRRLELGTAVAIAFPRSPMVTAQLAWDLAAYSGGRFILGLGTQVRAHIERRFSSPWHKPVAQLRDYIGALRAIWQSFQQNDRLSYRGEYYSHTLMAPFFNPGPIAHPDIPIYIAGVNTGLARLAGELCDGFHAHPLNSAKYTHEVLLPQIAAGTQQAGRNPADCVIAGSVFVISGPDPAAVDQAREAVRRQISFYASTPTYRAVLAVHGWESVGEQLSQLAAQQKWAEMPALVSDEMLDAFAIESSPAQLGRALRQRWQGLLGRMFLYVPFVPGEQDEFWAALVQQVAE
jgi:probable F420-dependent oxidoreductase